MAGTTGLEPATSAVTVQGKALKRKGLQHKPFLCWHGTAQCGTLRHRTEEKTNTKTDTSDIVLGLWLSDGTIRPTLSRVVMSVATATTESDRHWVGIRLKLRWIMFTSAHFAGSRHSS